MKHLINPLVCMCIPFSRCTLPQWTVNFRAIAPAMNAQHMDLYRINWPRDEARNDMVREARLVKSKFVLCLDDDTTVPSSIIRQMLFAFENMPDDVMVIGGIYCTKTTPAMPIVFKKFGEGNFYKWQLGEVFEAEVVGTGMMMIRTEVFDHISQPWFKDVDGVEEGKKWGVLPKDFDGDDFKINDDGFFCSKVREAGFRVMAHGGCLGMHWGQDGKVYLLPDTSFPMQQGMARRWKETPKDEDEYAARYFTLVKEYYGYIDLLPLEAPEVVA